MRFLVDAQLPASVARLLRDAGHDAVHTSELTDRNRTTDAEVCRIADGDRRVVVSKDRDFTAGARACPPEVCGGVGGYEELRGVLADPAYEEYEHLRAWAGAGFDADAFDAAAVTERLRRVR